MNRLGVAFNLMAMGGLVLGCTSVVPVVPHAIPCDISADLLAAECAQPSQLFEGATFTDLVDKMRVDRKALQECRLSQEALRQSIKSCNQKIDEFNQKIDELNRKNKP